MKKKDILKIISDAEKDIDKGVFTGKDEDSGIGIGNNQFRELASICRSAECYEEIELLIKYNRSKAAGEKGDQEKSWNYRMKNGRSLSELIVDCMQKIKKESEKNGEDCLGNLTLFFGYMYWNARIWGARSAEQNNSGYNNRGNGGGRFDNNRGGGQRNDRPDHRRNR